MMWVDKKWWCGRLL